MKITVGIDPGINHVGVAVFIDTGLYYASLARSKTPTVADNISRVVGVADEVFKAPGIRASVECGSLHNYRFVFEWPRIYMPGKSKAPGADILYLSAVDGAIAGRVMALGGEVTCTYPDGWKGQTPDNVMSGRILGRLDGGQQGGRESVVLANALDSIPKDLRHNVTDAVGIGLWALGRLKPSLGDSAPWTTSR